MSCCWTQGDLSISSVVCVHVLKYECHISQKSRVALARVTWTKPHILLLDEPSNHLDIDAVEALIQVRTWSALDINSKQFETIRNFMLLS